MAKTKPTKSSGNRDNRSEDHTPDGSNGSGGSNDEIHQLSPSEPPPPGLNTLPTNTSSTAPRNTTADMVKDADPLPSSSSGPHPSLGSPPIIHAGNTTQSQDADLFSFLSQMHLNNSGGVAPTQLLTSRKRKFLEQGLQNSPGSKFNGLRPPFMRRGSDEEDPGLHTPQCSQSGFADEEDHHHHLRETVLTSSSVQFLRSSMAGGPASQSGGSSSNNGGTGNSSRNNSNLLSPVNPHLMNEIDLATNFDDSLSGLGVDINTASMSEALLANLPNLSISSSQYFKQEQQSASGDLSHKYKSEPESRPSSNPHFGLSGNSAASGDSVPVSKNYGALDLSNDEAHLPDTPHSTKESASIGPKTFTGSVSRESSRGGTPQINSDRPMASAGPSGIKSSSNPNLASVGRKTSLPIGLPSAGEGIKERPNSSSSGRNTQAMVVPMQPPPSSTPVATTAQGGSLSAVGPQTTKAAERYERLNETPTVASDDLTKFQCILVASTSLATKKNEPSITYLNQGQSYELRLKKLGDVSAYRKKHLRCVMRICFHERRLQYMEAEQIADWKNAHAGERILDFDLPLSYGIVDPVQDPQSLNVLSFKWDPTRDTGIFIKVNCISTEFTPKKHGGEKGVPFRLQVETLDSMEDVRLHAAGCILQVFKLKGADRKHKQDRDKINRRPQAEQEKFAPSYDCTVLTDLSIENIYVPPSSRSGSPAASAPATPATPGPAITAGGSVAATTTAGPPESPGTMSTSASRDGSPGHQVTSRQVDKEAAAAVSTHGLASGSVPVSLSAASPVEMVTQWLSRNRYSQHIGVFRNFNGRDMLRLMREELISLIGMSEGIRLFNDLHMVQVAPRTTFYVAQKDSSEFRALFLDDLTVLDFVDKLSSALGVEPGIFSKIFVLGPGNVSILVTDRVIAYTRPESVFQFSLRASETKGAAATRDSNGPADTCDIILENVSSPLMGDPQFQDSQNVQSEFQAPPPPNVPYLSGQINGAAGSVASVHELLQQHHQQQLEQQHQHHPQLNPQERESSSSGESPD